MRNSLCRWLVPVLFVLLLFTTVDAAEIGRDARNKKAETVRKDIEAAKDRQKPRESE